MPTFVFSATQTYDDTNVSNVWNTSTANWDGSTVVWTNGNDAVFAGTGEAVAVTTVSANKINFNSTGYSLTGSTITLTGASPTITTAQNASITSVLAGSTGMVKAGDGVLSLTATNTYTGGTSVTAGTLRFGNSSTLPVLNGTYAITAGAMVQVEFPTTAALTARTAPAWTSYTGAGTLNIKANGTGTYFSPDLALPAGFTGTLRIDGGRVATPAGGGLGGATKVIVNPGGHFGMWNNGTTYGTGVSFEIAGTGYGEGTYEVAIRMGNSNSTSTINGPVLLTGSASVGAQFTNGVGVINGVISGATGANLTIGASTGTNLTGTIALGGANTFVGDTTVTMGTLRLDNALALQNSTLGGTAGAVTFNNTAGTAFTLGGLQGSRNLTLQTTTAAALNLSVGNNDASTSYGGILSGAGALTKIGTGTLTLTGVNTYTGNTTVNNGALYVSGAGRLGNGDYTGQLSIASGKTFEFGATSGTQVMRGSLTGSGDLIKSGGSTLSIGGTAAGFSGPISVTGGTLQIRGFVPFGSGVSLDLGDGTTLAPLALDDNNVPLNATSVTTPTVGTATIDLANTIFTLSSTPSPSNQIAVPIVGYSDPALAGGGLPALNLFLPRNYSGALANVSQQLSVVLDGFTPTVWTGSVNNLWNVATDTNWTLDAGVTPDMYQQGDVVRFDDTASGAGAVEVSLVGTITPNSVNFANATRPYTLSGAGSLSGAAPLFINGAAGVTLNTNNNFTGTVAINTGTVKIGHSNALGATGVLSGTTVAAGAALDLNGIAMAAETVTLNGTGIGGTGALVNTSATAVSTAAPVVVASAAAIGGTGNLTLSGGISGSFALSKVGTGALTIPNQVAYTGALSVNGGTLFTNGPNAAAGAIGNSSSVTINNGGAIYVGGDNSFVGHGPYASAKPITINTGGLLGCTTGSTNHLSEVVLDGGTMFSNTTSIYGTWNFDKGVSTPGNGKISYITGGNPAPTQVGGTTFNIGAGDTLMVNANLAKPSSTNVTNVIKQGPGTMVTTLNTYNSNTIIEGGTLVIPVAQSSPSFSVSDDAALTLIGTSGSSFSTGAMTFGLAGNTTFNVTNFGSQTLAANAPVKLSGLLTLDGTPTLNVSGHFSGPGTFPIVTYNSIGGVADFVLGSLPRNVIATLDWNTEGKSYDLNVTSVNATYWRGNVNGAWDVATTANWSYNSLADEYEQNDVVIFDESATGTRTVALNTQVAPASIVVDNSTTPYTISGSGAITGAAPLIKNGSGTLALATINSNTGGTVINAGTLSLGDGTSDGSVIGSVVNNASLVFNSPGTVTSNAAVSGTGSLTQVGSGYYALTSTPTFTGATLVSGGSLEVPSLLSSSSITTNGNLVFRQIVNTEVNPAGVITGTGGVTYTGPAVLTSTQGQFLVDEANSYAGNTTISNSRINLTNFAGVSSGSVITTSGGQLLLNSGLNTFSNPITLNGLGWIEGAGQLGSLRIIGGATVASPITVASNARISVYGSYGFITGVISGSADLEFAGNANTDPIHLTGTSVNTHSGKTIANSGMLVLNKTGTPAIFGPMQMGAGNGNQPRLVMQRSDQFGPGVEMSFANASGSWGRFEMQGTTQTLAGLSAGTLTTQGGAVIQNRAISDGSSNWGTSTLVLNGSGNYLFNGYIRDSDNGSSVTNALALVKNGTGVQTLAGNQLTYNGDTTVNQGTLVYATSGASGSSVRLTMATIASGAVMEFAPTVDTLYYNKNYVGGGTIRKSGSFVMDFAYNQHFPGNVALSPGALIDVQGGSLRLGYGANVIWTNNKSNMNVATGATFDTWDCSNVIINTLTGAGTVNRGVNYPAAGSGDGSLTVGINNGSGTFDGVITQAPDKTGKLSLVKVGTGTQTLNGVNTYSGTTRIEAGSVVLGAAAGLPNTSSVTILPGTTLDASAMLLGFAQSTGRSITAGRVSAPANDFIGTLYTAGTVNVVGSSVPGTFTISGDLGLDGGGILAMDFSSSAAAGNDKIVVGGALELLGVTTVNPLFNGAPDTANPYTLISHAGAISGDATNFTSGLVNSRYALSFDTTTSPGNVLMNVTGVGKSLVWSGAAAGVWVADTSTLNWNAGADYFQNLDAVTFDDTNATGTVTLNTTVSPAAISVGTVGAAGTSYTISGTGSITGGTAITKTGTGTLTLSTPNTFIGGVTVTQGDLRIGNLAGAGAGTVTLNPSGTDAVSFHPTGALNGIPNNIVVTNAGTGTASLGSIAGQGGLVVYNGNMILNRAVTINGSSDRTTLLGKISGNVGTITIAGSAGHRVTIANGANDFVGKLVISAGTIYQSDNQTALPLATDIENAGTYRLNGGGTHAVDSITGAGSILIIAGGATNLSLGNDNGNSDISGVISTAISLFKNGTGSLTLSGANTHTGTTLLSGGTTFLTNSLALQNSTLDWNNNGGTLDLGTLTAVTLGGLQGTQNFSMTNASATPIALTVGNASSSFAGGLLGGTTFTKTGTGSFLMTGSVANTYTGLTTVSNGNLGLAKQGVVAIPGSLTMTNIEGARLYTTQDNQFAPGAVLTLNGGTTGNSRFELLGTTQTLAGLANDGTGRGVVQTREQVTAPNVSPVSTLILDVPEAASYTYNGYLRGTGGTLRVIKNGPGKQVFSRPAADRFTYNGGTIINAGILEFGAGNTTDQLTAGGFTINAGGTMQSVAATNLLTPVTMNGGTLAGVGLGTAQFGHMVLGTNITVGGTQRSVISADMRVGSNNDRTITVNPTGDVDGVDLEITGKFGHINNSSWGYITKAGLGTMRFNGSTYSNTTTNITSDIGRITVNAGKVIFKDYMAMMGNGGLIINAGGTVDADMGTGVTYTYASTMTGTTGVFNKTGDGTLIRTGGGAFTGNINVKGGKLVAGAAGALGAANNSRLITVDAGKTLEFTAGNVFGNHTTTAAPIVVESGGVITNASPATNNGLGSLTLNNATLTATVGNGSSTIDPVNRPGEGYGAWGLNGTVTSTGTSSINVGAVTGMGGRILLSSQLSDTTFNVVSGTLTVSAPLQRGESATNNGLVKTGAGTMLLTAENLYTGNTSVNEGTLQLSDNAQLKFVLGASGVNNSISGTGTVVLDGDFVIDTTLADSLSSGTWTLENVSTLTGAYGASFSVVGFTDEGNNKWKKTVGSRVYTFDETTGILSMEQFTYEDWIASFGLTGADALGTADPDKDGILNAVEMVLGGNPATGMDTALLPTIELVNADPDGDTTFSDYLLFTYRRTDLSVSAGVTSGCETNTDLGAVWTAALGAPGVVILTNDNYNASFVPPAAADTDRVRVYVPRGTAPKIFGRLNVSVPAPTP